MFYERDMKLGEIISFVGEVIKRNKKIYVNIFLVYVMWNFLSACINTFLPDIELFSDFIIIGVYIISFCILLGIRKIIYDSLYDESYSDDFDKNSILQFVKERWLKALIAIIVMVIIGFIISGLLVGIPISVAVFSWVDGGSSFGLVLALVFTIIIIYILSVIFKFYALEINLNSHIQMVNSEVMSVLKIKKSQSFFTVLPLVIFNMLLYIGWFIILYGIGYLLADSGMGDANMRTIIVLVAIVGSVLLAIINMYVQILWVVKYYNMKNAIVYKINSGQANTNTVEYEEINVETNEDKEIEVETNEDKEIDLETNDNEEQQKENIDNESNVIEESSMWGSGTSIEDSIIGSDKNKEE